MSYCQSCADSERKLRELTAELEALRRVRDAAKALDAMYGHVWDRTDGALVLLPASIPQFEAASEALSEALAAAARHQEGKDEG